MKKIFSLIIVNLLFGYNLMAQNIQPTLINNLNQEECGFDKLHQEMMASDLLYKKNTEDFNALVTKAIANNKAGGTIYRVPVVVHVMHLGEAVGTGSNITEAAINQGIRQVNERFRKVAGSLGDGGGVDVEIEFALAVRDPLGNCTNGIVRFDLSGDATYAANGVRAASANGITDVALKANSRWDPTQYYNIYLISEFDDNDCGFGVQGYAYFASSHGNAIDGMVQLGCKFAVSGNTTLTHELGHAFNLYHTFEGDGGGGTCPTGTGDFCADTPDHRRSVSDCVTAANACDAGNSDLHIHNYMDYSSDACQSEFTANQEARASAAMVGPRASFLAVNGNMSLVPPTATNAAFTASSSTVCLGSPVSFYDDSDCIPNTYQNGAWAGLSFAWTFDNGVDPVITSTDQNPTITFANAGSYDVSLTVTDAFGSDTHSELAFVVVAVSPVGACSPTTGNVGNFGQTVYNVNFNTINNSTSTSANLAYTDFSCTANTIVTEGTTHQMNIDISAGGSGAEVVEVYIDYNNNGTFEAGELVLSGTTGAINTTTIVTGNVVIPTNAVENTLLRMRVYGETGTLTNNEKTCVSNLFIGDVEDYGVYIKSACTTPVISVTGTLNPTGCATTDGTITIGGTGAGNVTWTGTASGAATAITLPYTITGLAGGSYDITYGASGCVSASINSVLTALGSPAVPTISASGLLTFCAGGSVTLTSSQASGNVWSTGATTQSIVVTTAASYSVTFTNGGGCSAVSVATVVTVNALPAAPAISASGPTVICSGGSVNLTSSQASGNVWSTAETTQIITVTTTNSYTVQYTDGNGCLSPASAVMGVAIATSAVVVSCTPNSPNTGNFGQTVSNVTFNTINNATSTLANAGYTDFSCTANTVVNAGATHQLDIDLNTFTNGPEVVEVYIDYNNNGIFEVTELVLSGSIPISTAATVTGNVVIPTNAVENTLLRMRVYGETNTLTNNEKSCISNLFISDVEDYGVYIISNPLPIELLHFNAVADKNNEVLLDWQTATEINNDYFVLERSINNLEWTPIEKVSGAGNSSDVKSYDHTDEKPYFGTSYYRLKQVDFDGTVTYSKIKTVSIRKSVEVKTYPNPFRNELNFEIYADVGGEILVKVYSLLGSLVKTKKLVIQEGNNTIQANFSDLVQGSYIVKLSNGSTFQEHFKITKQ